MGMDIGMEKAGFHTRLASEIDKPTCETIRLNRPEVPLAAQEFFCKLSESQEEGGMGGFMSR